MLLALIWVDRPAGWVDVLIYVTVAMTVLSGVTTSSGCAGCCAARAAQVAAVEPLAHRDVMRGACSPVAISAAARRAARSARPRRCAGGSSRGSPGGPRRSARRRARGSGATTPRDHLAHAVLDEARAPVGLLDHRGLVGALHQLVDLRGHRVLGDLQQPVASISASQPSGQPICSVPRPRWLWVATGTASNTRSISSSEKPSLAQALAGARLDQPLRAGAGGHALGATPTSRRVPVATATARPCSV